MAGAGRGGDRHLVSRRSTPPRPPPGRRAAGPARAATAAARRSGRGRRRWPRRSGGRRPASGAGAAMPGYVGVGRGEAGRGPPRWPRPRPTALGRGRRWSTPCPPGRRPPPGPRRWCRRRRRAGGWRCGRSGSEPAPAAPDDDLDVVGPRRPRGPRRAAASSRSSPGGSVTGPRPGRRGTGRGRRRGPRTRSGRLALAAVGQPPRLPEGRAADRVHRAPERRWSARRRCRCAAPARACPLRISRAPLGAELEVDPRSSIDHDRLVSRYTPSSTPSSSSSSDAGRRRGGATRWSSG